MTRFAEKANLSYIYKKNYCFSPDRFKACHFKYNTSFLILKYFDRKHLDVYSKNV